MVKKITQAQKIRNYREKRPTASIADIAKALGIRYQAVYAVLKPNGKTPKKIHITKTQAVLANKLGISTKDYAEQIYKISKGRNRVRPIMVDMTQHADGTITEKVTEGYWTNHIQEDKPVDNVNHPAHYKVGGIETIDILKAKLTPEEFRGYLKGNVLKYLSRANNKGNYEEDLLKARWYLNREIAEFTKDI